jgi:hypothetical protein
VRRFFSLFLPVGAAFAASHGCNVYDPSLLEADPASRPAAKNGVGWWSKNDERGCFSAGMPRPEDRPAAQGDKDVGPIFLAVESMRLGSLNEQGVSDPNAWQDLGFDMDGACTASETCDLADPPSSCRSAASALPRDGRNCRDNTFGRLEHTASLVPELSKKYGLSDDAFNCALCVGHYNFLIRLSGYNGEPNDDRIRIDFYPSPGLESPLPWDCSKPDWKTHPCFLPDMPWTLEEKHLTEKRGGPDVPASKIFDDAAYVRDGYVVGQLPENTLFWFPGYKGLVVAFPLRVQKGLVVGKLSRGADAIWRVSDGIVAGRSRGEDIIKGFRLIGLCETTDKNYGLMSDFVNKNLDVLGDGRAEASASCDAMSIGVGFTAVQATAGTRLETVDPLVECVQPKTQGNADAGADGG